MNIRRALSAAATAVMLISAAPALPATAHSTGIHDNCTNLNNRWAHGVGRRGAVDQTSGTPRVTNFKRSTKLYRRAMNHNGTLDRDGDGIACERL